MKTRPALFAGLLLGALAMLPARAARDPFWPIGYEPSKPQAVERAPVVEPVIEMPEQPINETDWAKARKALVINGYTHSVRPETGETLTQVMINRHTYAAGDTLSTTNRDVYFVWSIESVAERALKLKPVQAERVKTKATPLKQEQKN